MKKVISFILCFVMLLPLVACGSKDTNQQNTPSANQTDAKDNTAPEEKPTEPKKSEYTLSEYLATGDTIWYMIDEIKGKESKVKQIFVIHPDGTLYTMKNVTYTLGELEQMDDADIAAMVKTEHVNQLLCKYGIFELDDETTYMSMLYDLIPRDNLYFLSGDKEDRVQNYVDIMLSHFADEERREMYKAPITDLVNTLYDFGKKYAPYPSTFDCYLQILETPEDKRDELVASYSENKVCYITEESLEALEHVSAKLAELARLRYQDIQAFKDAAQPSAYKLAIVTDSTGNNTSRMDLVHKQINNEGEAKVVAHPLTYVVRAGKNPGNSTMAVYDSLYGGYGNDGDYIFTRVSENIHFKLDAVGTNDLPVDIKDYKTLFE